MLLVGTDKFPILEYLPQNFLLIDDGPLIDRLTIPKRRKVTYFDFTEHSFNPLKGIDYLRARNFVALMDAIFPEGANTLTKKNANFVLLNALLSSPKNLDTLIIPDKKDPAVTDAYQKVQTILLSPVLRNVLTRPTNMSFKGIIVARLNRAELGDFNCFVLANLLIGQYQGHVVVPDFGFYGAPHHISLLRQNRLTAGVTVLDELPKQLQQRLLLMDRKIASHATYEDAETLAAYSGLSRGTNEFNDYVSRGMK